MIRILGKLLKAAGGTTLIYFAILALLILLGGSNTKEIANSFIDTAPVFYCGGILSYLLGDWLGRRYAK